MKCPRCVRALAPGDAACRECGFSLADQDALFGNDAVHLERVTDSAECFKPGDVAAIEHAITEFERAFPQLFFIVYTGALPALTSLRQFGFWLLNRAAVAPLEITRPNENGALLVIDTTSGSAALLLGYLLECYFTEEELAEILESARRPMRKKKFKAAVLAVMKELAREIKQKAAEAARDPRRFAPPRPAPPERPKFKRVHAGQKRAKREPEAEAESKQPKPKRPRKK